MQMQAKALHLQTPGFRKGSYMQPCWSGDTPGQIPRRAWRRPSSSSRRQAGLAEYQESAQRTERQQIDSCTGGTFLII